MLKPLALLLLAACAADPIDQNAENGGDDETSAVESNVIGSENMVEYNVNVSGNTLTRVNGDSWSNDWSHVVPLQVGSSQLLYLYSRSLGTAKVVKVNTNGSWSTLSTPTVASGWDQVLPQKAIGTGCNLVFYKRSTGELKTANVTATGGFSVTGTQTIPGPTKVPHLVGWDIATTATSTGLLGQLYLYEKSSGEAEMLTLSPLTHIFNTTPTQTYTWQTTWDRIESGNIDGDSNNVDDLAFFSESSGVLKLVQMNSDGTMGTGTVVANLAASGPSRLVVGDFANASFPDMLLYQTNGGPGSNGRIRIWNGGSLSQSFDDTNVQSGWTHLVPMDFAAAKQGILFYSNHGPV